MYVHYHLRFNKGYVMSTSPILQYYNYKEIFIESALISYES